LTIRLQPPGVLRTRLRIDAAHFLCIRSVARPSRTRRVTFHLVQLYDQQPLEAAVYAMSDFALKLDCKLCTRARHDATVIASALLSRTLSRAKLQYLLSAIPVLVARRVGERRRHGSANLIHCAAFRLFADFARTRPLVVGQPVKANVAHE
jgi:hypothetical protein